MCNFENSTLWKETLGCDTKGADKASVERLRVQFQCARDKVSQLAKDLSANARELTIHDLSHIDALWETGSIVVPRGLVANPLEGFVLGISFLGSSL